MYTIDYHLNCGVAQGKTVCSCLACFVVYPGFYLDSTGYQPYRQAIAGFLCFTLFALSP